jgi:hypothetical protein
MGNGSRWAAEKRTLVQSISRRHSLRGRVMGMDREYGKDRVRLKP